MCSVHGSEFKKRLPNSKSDTSEREAVCAMAREISAGGVVVRDIGGAWHVALIEPQEEDSRDADLHDADAQAADPQNGDPQDHDKDAPTGKARRKRSPAVMCLPKGLLDASEKAEAAAVREVFEETGIVAEAVIKLVDIKYVYVRTWGDGQRVFKIVSFYLMKYLSGEIGDIAPDMRIEVKRAAWIPLLEANKQMAYSGERGVLVKAQKFLAENRLLAKTSV
jgi:8-oxo-dGTP pyrophosphatase MutT (NUDIX family)